MPSKQNASHSHRILCIALHQAVTTTCCIGASRHAHRAQPVARVQIKVSLLFAMCVVQCSLRAVVQVQVSCVVVDKAAARAVQSTEAYLRRFCRYIVSENASACYCSGEAVANHGLCRKSFELWHKPLLPISIFCRSCLQRTAYMSLLLWMQLSSFY